MSTRPPLAIVRVDPQWAAAATDTGAILRRLGHRVVAADPPYGQALGVRGIVRWTAATELDARLLADRSRLDAPVRRHARIGRVFLAAGLPRPRGRERWQTRANRLFDTVDVLVTPALARTPIDAVEWRHRGWFANFWSNATYAPFAAPWNLAGWPAMTVPAGLDAAGMPLAVQLVGRPGAEALLLAVAAQLERTRPWPRLPPRHPAHRA